MGSAVMAEDGKRRKSSVLSERDAVPVMPKMPKEARIKEAENGYVVCWYPGDGGGEMQYVAEDFEDAVAHLKKYMG